MKTINPIDESSFFSHSSIRVNNYVVFFFAMILLISIGFLDYYTGYEISFSIFYLIPITIIVVLNNIRHAIIISIFSAVSWYLADINSGHFYQHPIIPVWNSIMRLGYFLLHSILLNKALLLYKKVRFESITDPITHVYNSRIFTELFNREIKKSKRMNYPFTLIYFDMDNFKKVNDQYGHQEGDTLLQLFSSLVEKNIRPADIFARLGGDEFILLLPETDYNNSDTLITRINEITSSEMQRRGWPVTLSIGAATFTIFDKTVREMIHHVDYLMYSAKQKGKNNIIHMLISEGQAMHTEA